MTEETKNVNPIEPNESKFCDSSTVWDIYVPDNEDSDKESKETHERAFAPHRRVSVRICKNCGRVYLVPDDDMMYCVKEFGTIPLVCEKCRKKKKEAFERAKEEND